MFQLFKAGMCDEEIAEQLGLKRKSVRYQMREVYKKMGVEGDRHKSRKLFAMLLKAVA